MRSKDQKMRFNEVELSLMKGLFAGNEDFIYTIRKVMLQFPVSKDERETLKMTVNDEVFALLKKLFLPTLDAEAPLFQLTDMHLGLNVDMKTLNPEGMWPLILAKELEIKYLAQQLECLRNVEKINDVEEKGISLGELTHVPKKADKEKVYVNLLARNYLVSFVDSNLQQAVFLAGLKTETVEETLKRLEQNSSK